MKTVEEKPFPRGGKKIIIGKPVNGEKLFPRGVEPDLKRRNKSSVFRVKTKEQPKKQKHSEEESNESEIEYADLLKEELEQEKKASSKTKSFIKIITRKSVSEGLVVLGCIGEINEFDLKINLPGRIIGYVPISNISDPYNAVLQKVVKGQQEEPGKLAEMFRVGQFVIVKVEKIERFEGSKSKFTLTLNPSKIYSDWSFKAMKKGLVLPAAVRSIEDHGYTMDFGIPDVRAFLKKQNAMEYERVWNNGQPLAVGQVVHCLVSKSSICENYCTVELTLNPRKVAGAILEDVTMSSIVPGMLFNVQVEEITNSGVVVKFAEDMTGYVHADHLMDLGTLVSSMQVGHELLGRVLYIEPYTKHVYFTLRKSICEKEIVAPTLQRGCIIPAAKVVTVRGGALLLKLKEQEQIYGIVTLQHLDKKIEAESENAFGKQLNKAYPLGSRHKCRILGYDYMLQIFTCTLEKELLKQPYLSPEDCKLGSVVDCVIQKAAPRGIRVSIGTVQGFVDPLHFADVPVAHPEKMFPVNKRVKAKILKVSKSSVEVTLRPSLINSSSTILQDYDNVEESEVYDGVVVDVKPNGCLIKFYGGVTGWLKKIDYFMGEPPQIGQVIKCKIYYSDPDERKILVRLAQDALKYIKRECDLKVGRFYNVSVTDIVVDGLVVSVEEDPIKGIIPAQQLSDCRQLGFMLCQTYKKGDKLRACCLSIQDNAIFSISPTFVDFFQSRAGKDLASFGESAVTKYMTIPTLIMQITRDMLVVDVPVRGMHPAFLLKRNVCDGPIDDFNSLGIEVYQTLVIKFIRIMPDSNSFALSKVSAVWNGYAEKGVRLLEDFVDCVERLTEHLVACEEPLADLHPGSKVKGLVISCSDSGALVSLSNGVHAVVPPDHYEEGEVFEGMRVAGTVMFVDVLNNSVDVTLREDVQLLISNAATNSLNTSDVGRELRGDVILTKPNLSLVCLFDEEKPHLAFVPLQKHINDLRPNTVMNEHDRYVIKLVKGAYAICVPKEMDVSKESVKEVAKMEAERKKIEEKKVQTLKSFPSQEISKNNGDKSEEAISENKPKKRKKRRKNSNVLTNTTTAESEVHMSGDEADENSKNEKKNLLNSSGGVKGSEKLLNKPERKSWVTVPEDEIIILKEESAEKLNKKRKSLSASEESAVIATKKKKYLSKGVESKDSTANNVLVWENGAIKTAKKKKKNSQNASDESMTSKEEVNTPKKKKKSLTVSESEEGSQKKEVLKQSEVEVLKTTKKKDKKKKQPTSDMSSDPNVNQKSFLDVNTEFVWDAKPEHLQALTKGDESDCSSSDDEKEEESLNKKKKKKRLSAAEKNAQMREEEERLRQVEVRLMDAEKNPQSADDFERLVMSTPNNSKNWIKYMAFHLQATEIEKARAVAKRALDTIIFREEQEKLNVWMALLNLENLYGTKETFDGTLQKAVQFNDDYKVYMQVIQMYADSGKIDKLDSLVKMMSKKYRSRKDMWLRTGEVYMKLGQFDKARQMMQKALMALEKSLHVELISRFALMENDNGQSERAETLMENILTSYPKRIDVWILYVDMLIKSKKVDLARQVLERSVVQPLPLNKLRSLYRKFLKFEQEHGTPEGEEKVHAMAKEHVKKAAQALK